MKTLKVQTLQDGISRNTTMLDTLDGEIQSLKTSISTFAGLKEALKGKGGSAIRSFYEDCHIPLLEFITKFSNDYKSVLEQVKSELNTLESSDDGYIHQPFLDHELEQSLNRIKQHTESLVSDANSTISSISDIVSVIAIQDSTFIQGIQSAKSEITETIDKLSHFDSSQSKSLSSAEEDLAMMENWIKDIEGLMEDGKVDVDFPAKEWKEYSGLTPLGMKLNGTSTEDLKLVSDKNRDSAQVHANAENKLAEIIVKKLSDGKAFFNSAEQGFRIYNAKKANGLSIEKIKNKSTGKVEYRVLVTKKGLEALGVEPDSKAVRDFNKGLPKNGKKPNDKQLRKASTNKTSLKFAAFASSDPKKNGWSALGKKVTELTPELAYWNDKNGILDKAKKVGTSTVKGIGDSLKDAVNLKAIKDSGVLKGGMKSLGPISAGLSFHSNYQDAVKDGEDGGDAVKRAVKDTVIDTAVSGGIQAGLTTLGTVAIPIPGVGTAIGAGAGIFVNTLLNRKSKKTGKSPMDKIKGWFR
ncbi:archaellum component FlaC [Rossellomorea marisflavi]